MQCFFSGTFAWFPGNFGNTNFLVIYHGHLFPHARLLFFKQNMMSALLFDYGRLFFFKEKFTMLAY